MTNILLNKMPFPFVFISLRTLLGVILLQFFSMGRHRVVFPSVVALQLLAYYVSSDKGFDVDKPRNLAKVVTVE